MILIDFILIKKVCTEDRKTGGREGKWEGVYAIYVGLTEVAEHQG